MARQGLHQHRKFLRLADRLGSAALARGILEMLWEPAYDSADDFVGDAEDIFLRCGRPAGLSAEGLTEAIDEAGFIDEEEDVPGHYRIHDLFDHAPPAVTKRATREAERMSRGETLSEIRKKVGQKGGLAKWASKRKQMKTFASEPLANGFEPLAKVSTQDTPHSTLHTPLSTHHPLPNARASQKPAAVAEKIPEPEDFEADSSGEYQPTAWGFWGWHNQERRAAELFDEPTPPTTLRKWHDTSVAKVQIPGLVRAYRAYLHDRAFGDKGWPFAVFMAESVWLTRANKLPEPARRL